MRKKGKPEASLPASQRVYAIGDIHGRLDLFEELIEAIERDDADAGKAETTVILLGDLVDRGPNSRGVVERAMRWQQERKVRCLAGNHEQMFLEALDKKQSLRHFIRFGGKETILSYGIEKSIYREASMETLQELYRAAVPNEHVEFLEGFEKLIEIGGYIFVHAGIQPGVAAAEQKRKDLLWIREPFLSYAKPHSHVVIHGHTITDKVEDRGNRIGIDTGAYMTGRLTALVLEGTTRRYLAAVEGKKSTKITEKVLSE